MMRKLSIPYATIFLVMLFSVLIAACSPKEQGLTSQEEIDEILQNYRSWTALQDLPRNVSDAIFMMCRLPTEAEMAFAESDEHGGYFLRDYMNKIGYSAFESGADTFPVGTVIVKEKFRGFDPDNLWLEPESFGIMIKRAAGFNPESNDWEFIYWESPSEVWQGIEASASCQACHSEAERDFVFAGSNE
jgi:hypothetical protein